MDFETSLYNEDVMCALQEQRIWIIHSARVAQFFTKTGAFVFGIKLTIVPSYGGVVNEYHWLMNMNL